MKNFDFKEKFGNTPVTPKLREQLIPRNVQNREELNEYELKNIAEAQSWLFKTNEKHKENSENRRKKYIAALDFARTDRSWEKIRQFMFS